MQLHSARLFDLFLNDNAC